MPKLRSWGLGKRFSLSLSLPQIWETGRNSVFVQGMLLITSTRKSFFFELTAGVRVTFCLVLQQA